MRGLAGVLVVVGLIVLAGARYPASAAAPAQSQDDRTLNRDFQQILVPLRSNPQNAQPGSPVLESVIAALRQFIAQHPNFAPAYDSLAGFLSWGPHGMDEAYTLEAKAIDLDKNNLTYRLNAALFLLQLKRPPDAIALMNDSMKLAKTDDQRNEIQSVITAANRNTENLRKNTTSKFTIVPPENGPPAGTPPTPGPGAPPVELDGKITYAVCTGAQLDLKLDDGTGPVPLRATDYTKVNFSAANFEPNGAPLHPCTDLRGFQAHITFLMMSGRVGEIVAVELSR